MLFIFDWDGTLQNSQQKIIRSMQIAAQQLGLPAFSSASVQNIIGLGLPEAILRLMPDESEEKRLLCQQQYSKVYVNEDKTPTPFFTGVESTLLALKEQGHTLAIATGKSRKGLDRILQSVPFEGVFSASRCADETESKPSPLMLREILSELNFSVEKAIMVGDSIYDMEMAKNIQMPRIAVNYGVHSEERLLQYTPFMMLSSIAEILQWQHHFEPL